MIVQSFVWYCPAMTTRSALVPRVAAHGRRPLVLGDVFPARAWRDAALVCSGAALTALGAQISVHIPPSPVPVTGQTLAVVLAGAALGARRGAASQALYVLLGFLLPIYADGASGPSTVWGATGGYLIGFVLAAGVIGRLAELGADRRVVAAVGTFATGQLVVFGIGVPWLKAVTGMPWPEAIHAGFTIFIVGGLIKALVAGVATPLAWRAVQRVDDAN
jgi:biotin transport system substrate-specific component